MVLLIALTIIFEMSVTAISSPSVAAAKRGPRRKSCIMTDRRPKNPMRKQAIAGGMENVVEKIPHVEILGRSHPRFPIWASRIHDPLNERMLRIGL